MKINKAIKEITGRIIIPDPKWSERFDVYLSLALLLIISTVYFYWFGNYIFFFQENLSLFVFSGEYLQQFAVKPGGLLEYAGNFLVQGYYNYAYGSILLSVLFIVLVIVFLRINKRLSSDGSYSLLFIVLPSCLMLLIQTRFNYLMSYNLGFLLAALYFLFSILPDKKINQIIVLAFFPLFYYFTGAFALIFLGMYIFYSIIYKKIVYPIFLLVIAVLTFYIFKEILFLQPVDKLIFYPLPIKETFIFPLSFYLLSGLIILYPLIIKTFYLLKIKLKRARIISLSLVAVVFILTVFSMARLYNADTVNLFKLEKLVIEQNWDGVIKQQEAFQSSNFIAEYYYNLALAEKNLLSDRMFFGRQDFGTRALIIPWDSQAGINNIFRGVYFYYAVGLVNEAHRWAFESMVTLGYRPENIKILIKTNLINGHYRIAEKYIHVLKKTLHYRKLAKSYEKMLNNPESIMSDPDLGEKIRIRPKEDFLIRIKNPQTNIPEILKSNPGNTKAFEYKMAWYLLEKNVGEITKELGTIKKLGYKKLPRHIEEAVLVFVNSLGPVPNTGIYKISSDTELRYLQYEAVTRPFGGSQASIADVQKKVGNTFWFYLDYK